MAEGTLASAVSVPEIEEKETAVTSPDSGHKRRNSSLSENGTKRRRLSEQHDRSHNNSTRQSPPLPDAGLDANLTRPSKRVASAAEERKRGQRLFGGLLGTLSQTSSTAAQKRRADIEQRQQAKLKQQDEQHSEAKRRKKEEIVGEGRRQQKELERASMTIRHRNLLLVANSLRTKVEPVLLWRPFQLRDEDEDIIAKQQQEAKETISKEESDFEERWRRGEQVDNQEEESTGKEPNGENHPPEESDKMNEQPSEEQTETLHDNENREADGNKGATEVDGNTASAMDKAEQSINNTHIQPSQRQDDEGEDIMEEDKEDMVLY